MNKISKATIGLTVAGLATLGVLTSTSASAAVPGESAPANTVDIPMTRIVNTPGRAISPAADVTVQVAGVDGIPADATGIEGYLTLFNAKSPTRAFVWSGVNGHPGTETVTGGVTTTLNSSGNTAPFTSALANGQVRVHSNASARFLLSVTKYDLPAAAPAAAPTFGVAQLQVAGTTWAQYETAELGSPVGDQASGTVRFTCKNATDGCDVSLQGYSTADGWSVYPRIVLEKEDNTTGAKLTCEYADGADNNGATQPLTGTAAAPTTVMLGIGSTADCGGSQTGAQPSSVDHINVPGAAGQGIHYDAFVTLTFTKS
ncbi:MAG TPA: hypothetical protein VFW65_12075 [Pseudonocardiaceae bacterium]|nr:hypothetical protein [Pseudonocardiaceae bacterium]